MKKIVYVFFLLTCLFSFGAVVHADNSLPFDPPTMEDGEGKEIEKPNVGNNINDSGKVDTEYSEKGKHKLGDKDPDYMYTSYLDTDNPIKTVTNNMVQGVFYFAKLLYRMTDWISSRLDKFNIIDTYADKVFTNGKTIYLSFFNAKNPVLYLMALGILWLLIKSYFKGNFPRTLGTIALILMFNIGYFTLGTKALKQINVQSENIVTSVVDKIKIEGVSTEVGNSFEIMVLKPFKDMNFEKESQYGTNNKNINDLLNSDNDSGEVEKIRKESGSEYLTGNLFGSKFTVALGAVVNNLVFSFVILAFKVAVVFAKTLLLVLFIIAPTVALLSFFEFSQLAMKNIVVKSFLLGAGATVLGGGTTLFIMLNNILDGALGGKNSNALFLAVAKIIIYVLLWKNRAFLASIFQANLSKLENNRVVQGMNHAFGQAKQKALAPVQQLALAGGYSAGQGFKALDNKVGRSALRNHGNQKRLGKYKSSLNTLADPTKDEKERKKAEKRMNRFEKRTAKNDKKQENPYLSKKKQNKLELEKKANAPFLDSKKPKPNTKEGLELKQLREKANLSPQEKERLEMKSKDTSDKNIQSQEFKPKDKSLELQPKDKESKEKGQRFVFEGDEKKREGKELKAPSVSQESKPQKVHSKKQKQKETKDKENLVKKFKPNPITQEPSRNPFEER
ncbi:hypothetical protein ACL43R_09720 [Lactococcus formosensis]|uniref:hypothetical protein n=1 Tax=Lactococcus formosensis TaxID=1281486 RepID=UPI0039F71151